MQVISTYMHYLKKCTVGYNAIKMRLMNGENVRVQYQRCVVLFDNVTLFRRRFANLRANYKEFFFLS